MRSLHLRLTAERGQTMAEYAILLGAIAIVVLAVVFLFGNSLAGIFRSTSAHV